MPMNDPENPVEIYTFAKPNSTSALRAASSRNPRNLPCLGAGLMVIHLRRSSRSTDDTRVWSPHW
jgi:hypothetical protein